MKKYVKFKPFDYTIFNNYSSKQNVFHMGNQGKTFEVTKINEDSYEIEHMFHWFSKYRFEEVHLVNLPDELFTM